ncbi:hypothetical protein GCM10011316_00040 [Roseibium aquae]|uniref:PAS domain S-box-containing protein/diguanylate cyclase (GGDEF)-like protein n=1 Tax=Roseibium aquae TaxID=1323746 RepID=A0A916T6D8_9HYPH|nr:diguanylate cyclase [Roseibium aquae]GGB31968.1 hypothetical protein GCM10011316_00040 [Roseibium aquae]
MNDVTAVELDLEATFGAIPDCVLITNPDNQLVYANRSAEAALGYSRSELDGLDAADIFADPDDHKRFYMPSGSRSVGTAPRTQVLMKRKSGEAFSAEIVNASLVNTGGTNLGSLILARDISDRLSAEMAAREAAQTLEDAMEAISEGFALYDKDDRLIIFNEKYREIYEQSANALIPGRTFEEIVAYGLSQNQYNTGDKSQGDWLAERVRRHQAADGALVEQNLADGRWLQISEHRTRSGGIAGIRTDITALKQAQAATRAAYASLETLANSLSCSIVEADRDGICKFVNRIAAEWFATSPEQLKGTRIRERLPKAYLDSSITQFEKALGGESSTMEINMLFPDGMTRDVLLEYIPKYNEFNEIEGVITYAVDITERKTTERTLAELYAITSTRELGQDEKINLIVRLGCEHFGLPFGIISHVIEDRYTVVRAESPNGEIQVGEQYDLGETFCAKTLQSDSAFAVSHTAESELASHPCARKFPLQAYIGAPLLVDGEVYGTINFSGPEPRRREFSPTDCEIIRQFADWVGHEIARHRDHEALMEAKIRMERIASIDDLTGIMNRRAFLERASTEVARFRRTRRPFTTIMMDVDHFKTINDTYGHAVGDEVLKQFAALVNGALRAVDVFGRVGGEEFCLLLHNTTIEDGLLVADRIRAKIANSCSVAPVEWDVTCSMGLTTIEDGDVDISALLQRADNALYRAKEEGRNRCVIYSRQKDLATI